MAGHYDRMNRVIHHGLRRDLARLEQVVAQPLDQEQREAVARRTAWMIAFLHHHHEAEDRLIWPAALDRQPDLAELMADMEDEHRALAAAADGLVAAAQTYSADGNEPNRARLEQAAAAMRAAMIPHLEHEESVTVPQVMALIDDERWKRIEQQIAGDYGLKETGWIGMWLLDDLGPQDTKFLRAEIPRPVVAYLSWRYGRAYDREAALAWGEWAGVRS